MAVTNFLVSSLPAYVQTNQDIIVKSFALVGTDTRRRIGLQTGIKKSAYLNYLDLDPTIQDGSSCGFDPLDEITISQREINVATHKVDGEICPETLLGKYAEYLVRVAATENDLPFEQYIVDTLVAQLNKKIETLIWEANSQSTDLFDGFIHQMSNDANVIAEAIAGGTTAYDGIKQVYLAMPEESLEKGLQRPRSEHPRPRRRPQHRGHLRRQPRLRHRRRERQRAGRPLVEPGREEIPLPGEVEHGRRLPLPRPGGPRYLRRRSYRLTSAQDAITETGWALPPAPFLKR